MNTSKDQFKSYVELVSRLAGLRRSSAELHQIDELLRELKSLLDESLRDLGGRSEEATVLESMRDSADSAGNDPEQLLKEVESLRMRMVSVLVMGTPEHLPASNEEWPCAAGPTITTPSGLTYGVVGGYCTVLLPTLETALQIELFGSDMLQVYDFAGSAKGIIVDCSAVRRLPNMCQAILLGYRHSFASRGKSFSIVWLHRDALVAGNPSNTAKAFRGEFLGEYLFTKRE